MTYEKFLIKLVDELFEEAVKCNYTWSQFAEKANLHPSTVYNLGTRKTQYPQLRTIFKLARAVGRDVKLIERKMKRIRKLAA